MILDPVFVDIETTGLNPFTEWIVAIGYHAWEEEGIMILIDEGEETILDDFYNMLQRTESPCLIGYNLQNFDLPFITCRMAIHRKPSPMLAFLRREVYRVDLMSVVTRYLQTTNKWCKLSDVATALGIPHDTEISGKDIPLLFEQGEKGKISWHCEKDVETVMILFEKLEDLCAHNLERRYNLQERVEWR